MMFAKEEGVPVEPRALAVRIRDAVADIVTRQSTAGIDIVNDGEMSSQAYATYIKDRLNGFGGESQPPPTRTSWRSRPAPEGLRRSRPRAAEDARLQRADQRSRSATP